MLSGDQKSKERQYAEQKELIASNRRRDGTGDAVRNVRFCGIASSFKGHRRAFGRHRIAAADRVRADRPLSTNDRRLARRRVPPTAVRGRTTSATRRANFRSATTARSVRARATRSGATGAAIATRNVAQQQLCATIREQQQSQRSRSNNQRSVASDRFRSVAGWRPGGRAPYAVHERVSSFGRVDRFERWHGGYRVWIGGGLYPIFVPFERWRLFPLRIGLNIRFGGFWDPLGYWSVYDYSPYDGYYNSGYGNVYGYNDGYNNDGYTSGAIRGTVESIDFRRGTMVINDDTSRQFVTITLPRDRRIDRHPGRRLRRVLGRLDAPRNLRGAKARSVGRRTRRRA